MVAKPRSSVLALEFEWWRDPDGCRLIQLPRDRDDEDEEHFIVHPLGIRPRIGLDRYRIVRAGGALEAYRPFERFGLGFLHRHFAKIAKATEALDFVSKFGPLTGDGLDADVGDDLDMVLVHAEAMAEMLWYASGSKRRRARVVDAEMPIEHRDHIASLNASFVLEEKTGRPRLRLSPRSFLDALWLSIYVDISQSGNLRFCKLCGERISSELRADAQFCCEAHTARWHSLSRTAEPADASRPGPRRKK